MKYPRDFHNWKNVWRNSNYLVIRSPTSYRALIHLIDNDVVQISGPDGEIIYRQEKIPFLSTLKYIFKKR